MACVRINVFFTARCLLSRRTLLAAPGQMSSTRENVIIRISNYDHGRDEPVLDSSSRFFRPPEPLDRSTYAMNSSEFLNCQPIISSAQTSRPCPIRAPTDSGPPGLRCVVHIRPPPGAPPIAHASLRETTVNFVRTRYLPPPRESRA